MFVFLAMEYSGEEKKDGLARWVNSAPGVELLVVCRSNGSKVWPSLGNARQGLVEVLF